MENVNSSSNFLLNSSAWEGRASRREFWKVNFLAGGLQLIGFLAVGLLSSFFKATNIALIITMVVPAIISIFCSIWAIRVSVRRLHDINKSGWNLVACAASTALLTAVINFIGKKGSTSLNTLAFICILTIFIYNTIWLYWLFLKKGDAAENRFGPPPN